VSDGVLSCKGAEYSHVGTHVDIDVAMGGLNIELLCRCIGKITDGPWSWAYPEWGAEQRRLW